MATSFEAMGSALYGKLSTVLPGKVFDTLAPGTVPANYVVFQRLTEIDEYTFGTARIENLEYLVKAVSDRDWPYPAYAMYATAHDAVQDAALTIPGYAQLRFRRTSTINFQDSDKNWHVGGVYRATIQKT